MSDQLAADRRLRTERNGRVLLGGHPFRIITLSRSGAATVRGWFAGGPAPSIGEDGDQQDLAARLIDAGMAHPIREPSDRPCHVVVPFRGERSELDTTLEGVRAQGPTSITVVDDGNQPPLLAIDDVTILRHEQSRGPGTARNTGWRDALARHRVEDGDVVVFVDAGVAIEDATVFARLAGHLTDPSVAAAAPRVVTTPGRSAIDRYEALHSPLDLGDEPSSVGPHERITYVPTACLAVRAGSLRASDGFDESLRYGEDVELVWRLSETSSVRYDPRLVVHHRARRTVAAFAEQRFRYASAAAPLAHRHPDTSGPWRTSAVGLLGVVTTSLGHPVVGFAVGVLPAEKLAGLLSATETPLPTAFRLLAVGQGWAMRSFAENMSRSWLTGSLALALRGRSSRPTRWWILAGWARRLTSTTDPMLLGLGVIDDVAYGCGVAVGAWRTRSLRAVRPVIRRWG